MSVFFELERYTDKGLNIAPCAYDLQKGWYLSQRRLDQRQIPGVEVSSIGIPAEDKPLVVVLTSITMLMGLILPWMALTLMVVDLGPSGWVLFKGSRLLHIGFKD